MIVHNFDPVLIDFGIVQIRWYSLAYILGILAGWWYGINIIKKQIQSVDQKNYIENSVIKLIKSHGKNCLVLSNPSSI